MNIWTPLLICLSLVALVEAAPPRRSRFWNDVGSAISHIPEVANFFDGKISIGSMTWSQINHLVKRVVSQIENVSEEVEEVKEDFKTMLLPTWPLWGY